MPISPLPLKPLSVLIPALSLCLLSLSAAPAGAAEITVSAAASLTNAFREIAQQYQNKYPDAKVQLNFGASGSLLQQILKGAPVDVFASADQETMDNADKQGLLMSGQRHDFVKNALLLVQPSDSKLVLKNLSDLNQPAIHKIAVGNPASVPVGRYTQQALETAQLWTTLEKAGKIIYTQNVRQSLDYVARAEVEAGFVYQTDAAIMKDKVRTVLEVPLKNPVSYPVAVLKDSAQAAEAKRFVAFLFQSESQAILNKYGFQKP